MLPWPYCWGLDCRVGSCVKVHRPIALVLLHVSGKCGRVLAVMYGIFPRTFKSMRAPLEHARECLENDGQ